MSNLLKQSIGNSIQANLSGATQPKKKEEVVKPKEVKAEKKKPVAKPKKVAAKPAKSRPSNLREGDDRFQSSLPAEMIKRIRIQAITEGLSMRDYTVRVFGDELGYSAAEIEEMTKVVKGTRG